MCNKSSSATSRRVARAAVGPKPPARRVRTKTRKPKYLSLKLELSSHKCNKKTRTQQQKKKRLEMGNTHKRQHQLNLFPLYPENLVEVVVQDVRVDMQEHDDHVALLFETATDSSTNTLQGLLDSTTTTTTTTTTVTTPTTTTSEESPLSPRLHWGRDHVEDRCGGSSSLERTAMRCKGRDRSEERWVSYWEVVKREQEEVSSTTTDYCSGASDGTGKMMQVQETRRGLVGLKLDYQEIMNAWCDKGPLYVEGESSQTVPDILPDGSDAFVDTWGSMGNSWAVPEMADTNMKFWRREASVLRYKEKRQSRLFSKRIRYEVRKLNAEKRPRLKGRFVKRNEDL